MERDLHARDRVGVQDSVLLENFRSEEAFVDNLEKRFKENLIYTYIGPVLVSVNPYKNLPIYGPEYVEKYRNVHFYEVPPHVFAVTDTALRSLRAEQQDQCILISGESGAGKTEASKKVLQFIAATARQKSTVESVKDKLLNTNPLLEAFGNAKTNRNDNSSRFGKYMDVAFDRTGDPVGGNILNYLLEKSRVVYQATGERNFHIFYQLLAGTDNAHLEKLGLKRDPKHYFYLNQGKSQELPSIDESAQFKVVEQAMKVIELGTEEQDAIWVLVAVILHLGNLGFVSDGGRAKLSNNDAVKTIAKLLGCNANDLEKSLLNRTIEARGDVVVTPLDYEQAMYARDALAKAVYARLFNWLVKRLNASLKAEYEGKTSVLGILDIYGFEIFQCNSFEQFCINYCNEKLQQLFIELTLKSEQEEYRREGIEWEPVEYFDNKIICDLVEVKHKGIIAILDEECLRPGDATDLTFLGKMDEVLKSHPHYMSHVKADNKTKKTIERKEFRLQHYAGEVTYSVHGFLEKNNDLLFRDLKEVMVSTHNMITKAVFQAAELQSKRRPETAALQFKTSLAQLVDILMKKEPSYIRCIKPNETKHSGRFDRAIVGHQVKYLGLMENLRVRRAGFAYRRPYESFLGRYKCLCPATWPHPTGPVKESVQKLVSHLGYKKEDYGMGKTKIFIRLPKTLFETEDAFQSKKHDLATLIQKVYKGKLQRRKFLKMRAAAIVIQAQIRRFLAQKAAKKRRWAVAIIRQFIQGFIARNQSPNVANQAFIRFVRYQFLIRLRTQLPQKVLDKSWPAAPLSCQEASQHLRVMYTKWLVQRYCKTISPPRKRQFELKVLAELLLKDKKANYPESISQWFIDNRLPLEQQTLVKTNFESGTKPPSERVVYDRHGYTPRQRIVVLTSSALYVLDAKDAKVKHRFPLSAITALVITNMTDGLMLIRIPQDQKKDKGDLILGCDFLIETVTYVIDTTKSADMLLIEDSASISHQMVGGKQGTIEITRGNNLAYTKGKNGHLIIVTKSPMDSPIA